MSWQSRGVEPDPPQNTNASGAGGGDASRRPSMKIIVRLLIYIPRLGYFGYQAARANIEKRKVADDNFRVELQRWLSHPPQTIVMPGWV